MAIFQARNLFCRRFSSVMSQPFYVCIVGSGPAGFYTAEKMLKAHKNAEIDIIDRLPTPFGLVRSGVAPDHPETKIVVNQFARVASSERCSFFGNVCLGTSIPLSLLRSMYHVVVLSYGAESDRALGIPGEDLLGIYSAREFVWWYNGHPDCSNLKPDLKTTDTAIVLGQGNVALDVARILLRSREELATTDIASHALLSLKESSIRKVYLVGRRGPVQAACTTKELREILGIKNLHVQINEVDLVKTPADEEALKNNRLQRRLYELFTRAATSQHSQSICCENELHFVFFRKPDKFLHLQDQTKVSGVHFEKTILKEDDSYGRQSAVGTGEFEVLDCGLVLKSIGYKSIPVNELPFDHSRGGSDEIVEKGLYVSGWLKRGPTGIIGTNLFCAEETVASITEDINNGLLAPSSTPPKLGRASLLETLELKGITPVTFSCWEKIDSKEKSLGSLKSKPREKITTWDELLRVAND